MAAPRALPPFITWRAADACSAASRRDRPEQYVYDPGIRAHRRQRCAAIQVFAWGPLDQRAVETRSDVLVYSSPPLKRRWK